MTWADECVVPLDEAFGLSPELTRRIAAALPFVERYAKRNNLAVDLVLGVIYVESRFNPRAASPAGAAGLMQIMPKTFEYIASRVRLPSADRLDPETSIAAGTWLLASLLRRYKMSVTLALAAYNAGAGNVDKHGGVPPFVETRNYVKAVPRAAENFRIARTQRCRGYQEEPLTWSTQGRGRGGGTRRPRRQPPTAPPMPPPPASDGMGAAVLLALGLGLAWGWKR